MKQGIYIVILCVSFMAGYSLNRQPAAEPLIQIQRDTVVIDARTEWARLVDALVAVESEGKADAINARTGAAGILQIMPVYVAEVNRLISEERYTDNDRTSVEKSVEMWYYYNLYKNPERDIEKAIYLHNPRGGNSYKQRVLNVKNNGNKL